MTIKERLNPYLEEFYMELFILCINEPEHPLYNRKPSEEEFKDFILGMSRHVDISIFEKYFNNYPLLEKAHDIYVHKYMHCPTDDTYDPDTPTLYTFYMGTHFPFTKKYQPIINILLREKKLKNILNKFGS